MPNIRQYENQETLQPNDRGTQAYAVSAYHTERVYAQLGSSLGGGIANLGKQWVQHKTAQEVSQGLATRAQIQDNLTTAWDVTVKNADPNDPTVADKFREEQLNPILDAWTTGFTTQEGKQWAEEQAAQLRDHFFLKTASDQSSLAGEASVQNLNAFGTGLSNSAMQDPSSLPMTLKSLDAGIDALVNASPNLSPGDALKMKAQLRQEWRQKITKSAFIGMATANPSAAVDALAGGFGADVLDGTERQQLSAFAQTQARMQREDQRAAQRDADEKAKKAADAQANALINSTINPTTGEVSIPPGFFGKIATIPEGMNPGERRAMIDWAQSQNNKEENVVTDPHTYSDFAARMVLPPTDPHALKMEEVYQAAADKRLSRKDFSFFKGAYDDLQKTPENRTELKARHDYIAGFKSYLTKSNMLNVDAYGDQRYAEFESWANEYWAREKGDMSEQQIKDNIRRQIPRFQITSAQSLAGKEAQARGQGLPPLPPVVVPYRQIGKGGPSFEDMDRVANGGK